MKSILRIFLSITLMIISQNVSGQTYTIPWAQQQPAWVFPLWFEDGNGAKDTVYYCFDSTAVSYNCLMPDDTIFGEKLIEAATGKFSLFFESQNNLCSAHYKVCVNEYLEDNGYIIGPVIIYGCNVIMPLTIRWDPLLFYSQEMPMPDLYPAPKVEGLLRFESPMFAGSDCTFEAPILITDTITNQFTCYRVDSVILTGEQFSLLIFGLRPWSGEWVGIQNLTVNQNNIRIQPNPVSTFFSLVIDKKIEKFKSLEIYNAWDRKN